MVKRKILLIDDEREFTDALGKRLELRDMHVETAGSGKEALALVKAHDFDVVLLDLAMPGWDGLDTIRHLKSARKELQIILLTGYATVRSGVDAMKLGARDVMEKPADFDELMAKMEEAFASRDRLRLENLDSSFEDIARKHGW